jgi:hypothetical protein
MRVVKVNAAARPSDALVPSKPHGAPGTYQRPGGFR